MAVFVLNFKVFKFGYKKTKYVKTLTEYTQAKEQSEFWEAPSYLDATLDVT